MVKTLIVFKELKNVSKLNLSADVEVTVSMGGSMNTCLMLKWIRSCFTQRGPFLARTPSILYMDYYESHIEEEVSEFLRSHCATKVVVIPPKVTRSCSHWTLHSIVLLRLLFVEIGWTGL